MKRLLISIVLLFPVAAAALDHPTGYNCNDPCNSDLMGVCCYVPPTPVPGETPAPGTPTPVAFSNGNDGCTRTCPNDDKNKEQFCVPENGEPRCYNHLGWCIATCDLKQGGLIEDSDPPEYCKKCMKRPGSSQFACYDDCLCNYQDQMTCDWEKSDLGVPTGGCMPGSCEQMEQDTNEWNNLHKPPKCNIVVVHPDGSRDDPQQVEHVCQDTFCACQGGSHCGNPMATHFYGPCSCPVGTSVCTTDRCSSDAVCCPDGFECQANAAGSFDCIPGIPGGPSGRHLFIKQ